MDGWSTDLPLLSGYYWVRIAGYERPPTIIEIDIRDGAPMVLHEEPSEPDQEPQARWWMPLTQRNTHTKTRRRSGGRWCRRSKRGTGSARSRP